MLKHSNTWQPTLVLLLLLLWQCGKGPENKEANEIPQHSISLEAATQLASLPLACIGTEYPNKLNQTIGSKSDLQEPHTLHPAFYGCFDWHSSVHGHWSLVKLLKSQGNLPQSDSIKSLLLSHISEQNILLEIEYFDGQYNKSFERTYGWAWLLKLAEELHTWDDPIARKLEANLQPLTDRIVHNYLDFLPKLEYPIRVGTHTNTAFGLTFAYDYAQTLGCDSLLNLISSRAKEYFLNDKNCPLEWEPSGYDFLSPCLEEIDLMMRVLPENEFLNWLKDFTPQLFDQNFKLEPGRIADRTDGHLVHLDGLNFSRAWVLSTLALKYPDKFGHLQKIATNHIEYSYPNLIGDSYEGGHWLASFAIYALDSQKL